MKMSPYTTHSLLAQRRADQTRIEGSQLYVEHIQRADQVSKWEHDTDKSIICNNLYAKAASNIKRDEEDLERRRKALRMLYESEMNVWKQKIREKQHVSMEERMEQIRVRAYKLRDEREAARVKFVEQCYHRQWQDSCDEARTMQRKDAQTRYLREQELLMKARGDISKNSDAENARRETELNEHMRVTSARADADIQAKKDRDNAYRHALKAQVEYCASQMEIEADNNRDRQQNLLDQWRREEGEANVKEQNRLASEKYKSLQDHECNLSNHDEKIKAAELDIERDKLVLEYNIQKEVDEISHEDAKQRNYRDAIKIYHEELSRKQHTKEQEATISEVTNSAWDDYDAREDSKRQSSFEIQRALYAQQREKMERERLYRMQDAVEHAKIKSKIETEAELERKKENDRRAAAIANQDANKALMEAKRHQRLCDRETDKNAFQEQLKRERDEFNENLRLMQRKGGRGACS